MIERPVDVSKTARHGDQIDISRADLLATVAELYYLEGRDQRSIAEEVGTSRSNVSRLLTEARRRGIVEIRINRELGRSDTLEGQLIQRLGLEEARVLAGRREMSADDALSAVGRLAADYLIESLVDGLRIGLSWGTSLAAMVQAVAPTRTYEVDVVQILGGLSSVSSSLSGHELGRDLADRLGGKFYYLHAPAVVDSVEVRDSLLRQPAIASVLARAQEVDIAFVGIGSLGTGSLRTLLTSEAGLSASELKQLQLGGVAGDVCVNLFTAEGEHCASPISDRVIGVEPHDLRRIARVVGVARGLEKAKGVLGAVRARLVNVVVTDEATASEVLRLNDDL